MKPTTRAARVGTLQYLLLASIPAVLPTAAVDAQEEIKINMRWLGDRVLLTWGCDHFQGTHMAVVVTAEGLVVIDTGLSPTTVRRQRELVEKELGRSDFRYLINTHMHNDHAFANEVFPEPTVVGPEGGVVALEREVGSIPALLERLRRSRDSYAQWAAATSPDSLEGRSAREGVAAFGVGIADLERGIEPRYPTSTFRGHRTLDLGDVHLELFEFTGFHSDSDILILLPEERMVFTGDVFWGGQLPVLQVKTSAELDRLLAHWKTVLEECPDLEHTVPAHSDVPLTVEQFRGMYAYLSRLSSDVRAAKATGTGIVRFLMQSLGVAAFLIGSV
jgi:cyclase